jgi:hypothetical protein
MGIIADNMGEVVQRTQGDPAGPKTDLRHADTVEFIVSGSVVSVNVDGHCALYIANAGTTLIDTSAATANVGQAVHTEDK